MNFVLPRLQPVSDIFHPEEAQNSSVLRCDTGGERVVRMRVYK